MWVVLVQMEGVGGEGWYQGAMDRMQEGWGRVWGQDDHHVLFIWAATCSLLRWRRQEGDLVYAER